MSLFLCQSLRLVSRNNVAVRRVCQSVQPARSLAFRKNYAGKIRKVRGLDFERFTGLCLHLQQENRALVRKITDGRGRLLAAALLFKDEKRIYNMLNVVIPEGKKKFANHFLFDNIVSEFSGSGLTLDFEGSEVPEIRKFYEHFGAANQPYYLYRNILP